MNIAFHDIEEEVENVDIKGQLSTFLEFAYSHNILNDRFHKTIFAIYVSNYNKNKDIS